MGALPGPREDLQHLPGDRCHAVQGEEAVSHEGLRRGGGGEGDEEGGQQKLETDQQDVDRGRRQSCGRAGKIKGPFDAKSLQKCRNKEHQKSQQKPTGLELFIFQEKIHQTSSCQIWALVAKVLCLNINHKLDPPPIMMKS